MQPPGLPGGSLNESGDEAVEDEATTCEADVCICRAFFVDSRNSRLERNIPKQLGLYSLQGRAGLGGVDIREN